MGIILQIESDLETRQDRLFNELSWSSFGHWEGLQNLAPKHEIFPVLALRICTGVAPSYLVAVPFSRVIAKDILEP